MIAEAERLRSLLRRVQWGARLPSGVTLIRACPCCGGVRPTHIAPCELAAAIGATAAPPSSSSEPVSLHAQEAA